MALFCSSREFDMLCHAVAGRADLVRLQVRGGSMFPFIRSGDWVEAALCKAGGTGIRKGDIVLFRRDESLLMHRVLRSEKGGFVVKGDTAIGNDGIVPPGDIIARVIAIERNARRIDLCSRTNRRIASAAADISEFLQHPVLVAEKISAFASAKIKALSKENLFLRSLLRHDAGSGLVAEAVNSGPDWQRVLDRSVAEGIFYPLYRTLKKLIGAIDSIPQALRERFEQTYLSHVAQGENFFSQATQLLRRLDALNIRILLFKGPAIDPLIYNDFYRPRTDLDIAVNDEDAPLIREALAAAGPSMVHIHSHLFNNTWLSADNYLEAVDMKRVWQETTSFGIYRNIRTLRPEMNILFLCEHALKHDVDQLVFLYEIDRLMRFYGARFDWQKFIALTEEFGLKRIVYYGLYFTKEMLSGDIPDEVLRILKPEKLTSGERKFIRNTLGRKAGRYSAYSVYLASRKSFARKTYFLFRTVFSHAGRLILP